MPTEYDAFYAILKSMGVDDAWDDGCDDEDDGSVKFIMVGYSRFYFSESGRFVKWSCCEQGRDYPRVKND